jgi:Flp pilus assembly protein TadD/nitrous oxidase accessory protein NosD
MIRKRHVLTILFLPLILAAPTRAQQGLSWSWSAGLGIYVCQINQPLSQDLKLDRSQGLLVLAVARSGVGNQSGIKAGDVISSVAPNELWSEDGKSGTVELVRQGKPLSLSVTSHKVSDDAARDLIHDVQPRAPSTFTVDPQGGGDFKTITAAVFRAVRGDTLVLKPASYHEAVFIPEGVVMRAETTARVETTSPWLAQSVTKLQIHGLSFATNLFIENGDDVQVDDCSFLVPEKKTGIVIEGSHAVRITHDTFNGAAQTTGLASYDSQLTISDSFFSGEGTGVTLRHGSRAELRNNVLDTAANGILTYESELVIFKNLLSGKWDGKSTTPDFGIRLEKSALELTKTSIRSHRFGIAVIDASRPVMIADATVTQTRDAISFFSTSGTISGSLIMENVHDGIYIGKMEKDTDPVPRDVKLLRNTVSQNEGQGISVSNFSEVTISENLIEANGAGIELQSARATVTNNTVTLQKYTGILIGEKCDVKIFNNVVAFNSFGLFVNAGARREVGFNDVYGNLARTEFPLVDGNYGRTDHYVTADGKKVPIDVYPAYDLKSPTDLSVDPGFVKLGSDYSFKSDSLLASARGRDRRLLGAFAPPAAAESSPATIERGPANRRGSASARRNKGNRTARQPSAPRASVPREPASGALADSQKLVAQGDNYMASSKWNEALAAYNQAIAVAPANAEAYYSLGWAYNQMGRHGEAFAPLVKAIQLDSQFAEAHFAIGYAYLRGANYVKAIPFFRNAIKLDAEYAEAHYGLAQAYLRGGDKTAAMQEYTILKELDANMAQTLLSEIEKN